MKKIAILLAAFLAASAAAVAFVTNAQIASNGSAGAGASGAGYAAPGYVISSGGTVSSGSSGPAVVYPTPVPPPTPAPPVYSGFIEFNNLTVERISATHPPAEVLATSPVIYPTPMMGAIPSVSAASSATCYKFDSQDSVSGTAMRCPTLPSASTGTGISMPNISPYRIEIGVSAKLMLRDRSSAALSDFAPGDQINVFGYYNADGSIQAYLVRDLSKPPQDQFIQLNTVTLVSVSASATPATLVVAQAQGYPCYGYGTNVAPAARQSIACPLGVTDPSANPATENVAVPPSMMPDWRYLGKYVVKIDSQTVILDSSRAELSLSDLEPGDSLNIYGDTTDNGQTLSADIVRDLSVPPAPQIYSGTVTRVNADGSFVVQASDGRTITVQSPVKVGASLTITGLLDRLSNVLSRVSSIVSGGGFAPGQPVPMNVVR